MTTVSYAQTKKIQESQFAIPFSLKESGYVTLVIENEDGVRVRNLIADTWCDAGKNTAWWDGRDDTGRDVNAAEHGIYNIPAKFVSPGKYIVRGIVHSKINTTYEFSVYATGTPPWSTDDHTGGWLANHSAPQAALFVPAGQSPTNQPAVYLGAYTTEGTDGLAWVDLEGKKVGGKKWIGGNWTGAPYLARDKGEKGNKKVLAYTASTWSQGKKKDSIQLRITGLTAGGDKSMLKYAIGPTIPKIDSNREISGLAVHNNICVVSLPMRKKLIVVDLNLGKVISTINIKAPQGLFFDNTGNLLTITDNKLVQYKITNGKVVNAPKTIINEGLEAPVGITLASDGDIYISDGGNSHQVKVFTAAGKFIRIIGKSGRPKAGPYDPLHMNNPTGITIDSNDHLWVTENDFLPKRVSVWSLDGSFIKAFYGPAKYGGGGMLDPTDKTKFYYAEKGRGSMEFKLDWKTGECILTNVLYRQTSGDLPLSSAAPESPLHHNGKRFFTNCYNTNPTNGTNIAFVFREKNGQAYPCAAMGNATEWALFEQDLFKNLLPPQDKKKKKTSSFFIWSDLNGDVQVQPDEITITADRATGVTVMDDLSFCLSLNLNAVQFKPTSFTNGGIPIYKNEPFVLVKGLSGRASSGGNQTLVTNSGSVVTTQGIAPFNKHSVSGARNGKPLWSYPNMWPGLHASHNAPVPEFSGELIGTTRLLGGLFNTGQKVGSDALWAVNSNHGMAYIFTADGLFVTTLFKPMRGGDRWNIPVANRGMSVDHLSLGEENFWPGITQTEDGKVYLIDGSNSSIINVDGLQTIRRLPEISINVTATDLAKVSESLNDAAILSLKNSTPKILKVITNTTPIKVDGKIEEWVKNEWADIDKRGVKAYFNSHSKPYNITASTAVSSGKIYFAFRTGDRNILKNSGEIENALFTTGGALDIMMGTNPNLKNNRNDAEEGDLRILITLVDKKPQAWLYRAVVKGTKQADKVPFSSPQRTITFDKVENISSKIEFAASGNGDYEISIPLSILNLNPKKGTTISGDIGILRGDGQETISRAYWSNKNAGIVSDVPSEAELTPARWGTWIFE